MSLNIKHLYIVYFFCSSLLCVASEVELEENRLAKALNAFVSEKSSEYELDPKKLPLILETTKRYGNQWPSANIIEINGSGMGIVLIWQSIKGYIAANHPQFPFSDKLQPLINKDIFRIILRPREESHPFSLDNESLPLKKIEEIDPNDPELLPHHFFFPENTLKSSIN